MLCVSRCGSLLAHIRVSAVFHTASRSYLLPSKSHTVSYTRFARDDPVCVFEELIQYYTILLCGGVGLKKADGYHLSIFLFRIRRALSQVIPATAAMVSIHPHTGILRILKHRTLTHIWLITLFF